MRSKAMRLGALLLLSTTSSWSVAETRPERTVEIRWTKFGMPHIKAADYESLGFGYGYALAGDRYCELAGRALTFRGERSRWYGADADITVGFLKMTNITSDLLYRTQLPDALVQKALDALQPKTKDYLRGFVAGLNRYVGGLSDKDRKALCGGIHVPEFRDSDIARSLMSLMVISKGFEIGPEMLSSGAAWNPGAGATAQRQAITPVSIEAGFGSNAWAYGGDVVKGGGAIMFANPHSGWVQSENQLRLLLHKVHLTIPGEIDVAGASFWSFPLPLVGFNKDVTWTILDAGQSVTAYVRQAMTVGGAGEQPYYMMDGVRKPLEIRTIPIEALEADGKVSVRNFTFAFSELGPIYKVPEGAGRPAGWYAYTDANEGSAHGLDQFLAVAKSENVSDFVSAVENNRGIASHLMAADRHGDLAFLESVQVLAASDAQVQKCHIGGDAVLFNIVDGSRQECAFRDAGVPIRAPKSAYPNLFSRGIVHNTNNSYKYTEFGKVQASASRFFGNPVVPEANIRHVMSARRMKEISADGVVTPEEAHQVIFDHRNFAAEEYLDDILALCGNATSGDVQTGCAVLRGWERKNEADSRGALLFHQLWNRIIAMKTVLPANNPVDLQVKRPLSITPQTGPAIAEAIGASVRELKELGFSADAAWGEALYGDTASGRIPLHGGSYHEGILNGEQPPKLEKGGFPYIMFGTAYPQFVRWENGKVRADILLTHGQTGTESEGRTAQMKMFANKQLYRLPFTQEELAKAEIVKTIVLSPDVQK